MMNHYITTENKIFGFDETQTNLIPTNAILIPSKYTFNQYSYLTLVDGSINYNKEQYDIDTQTLQEEIAEYNSKQYQRDRAKEYPDFREYLDGIVKGDNAQVQKYINDCLAVKAKYPKE